MLEQAILQASSPTHLPSLPPPPSSYKLPSSPSSHHSPSSSSHHSFSSSSHQPSSQSSTSHPHQPVSDILRHKAPPAASSSSALTTHHSRHHPLSSTKDPFYDSSLTSSVQLNKPSNDAKAQKGCSYIVFVFFVDKIFFICFFNYSLLICKQLHSVRTKINYFLFQNSNFYHFYVTLYLSCFHLLGACLMLTE